MDVYLRGQDLDRGADNISSLLEDLRLDEVDDVADAVGPEMEPVGRDEEGRHTAGEKIGVVRTARTATPGIGVIQQVLGKPRLQNLPDLGPIVGSPEID